MNEVLGLNEEAWNRWIAYKRKMRKAYRTEFAIERAQKKLAGFGEYQMQVVERSMENEWQGLFPLPKGEIAALEKKKRDDSKRIRNLAELAARAAKVDFRQPFAGEDEIGYRTLVERAEDQHWRKRRSGPASIGELLGAKP